MTQEHTLELYTYSVVRDPEEPRWTETGIPDIYFASFEEVKAEIMRLRDDLQSADGNTARRPYMSSTILAVSTTLNGDTTVPFIFDRTA